MNRILILIAMFTFLSFSACNKSNDTFVEIETDFGTMKVLLYNETPLHKANFIKLVKEGFYDDLLFHRVIKDFMIQGGDPNSKGAKPGQALGNGGPGYLIDNEIGFPHFKGTLAAARTGGPANPDKKSSGSQFYIIQGQPQTDQSMKSWEQRKKTTYSPADHERYKKFGGRPDLDLEYTVFGEVVSGMDIIDKVAAVQTAPGDRPIEDVKMKMRIAN